jgi:hypothetical protein
MGTRLNLMILLCHPRSPKECHARETEYETRFCLVMSSHTCLLPQIYRYASTSSEIRRRPIAVSSERQWAIGWSVRNEIA